MEAMAQHKITNTSNAKLLANTQTNSNICFVFFCRHKTFVPLNNLWWVNTGYAS